MSRLIVVTPLRPNHHTGQFTPMPCGIAGRNQVALNVRGRPISAGWNSAAAASVQASDSASSLPMLEVPGWLENHRLPKAVAVVAALKITARVRLDCRSLVRPDRQAIT